MKASADKCHLLVLNVTAKIGEFDIKNNREEKLLGVKIEIKPSFENLISLLSKRYMLSNYWSLVKCKSLVKAFKTSQFNYWPLIWMFHRQRNNQINKIHEKTLRLSYQDNKKLSFNDPLKLVNSITIRQRKLRTLEIMKELIKEVFEIKEPHYNFRSEVSHFKKKNIKSIYSLWHFISAVFRTKEIGIIALRYQKL